MWIMGKVKSKVILLLSIIAILFIALSFGVIKNNNEVKAATGANITSDIGLCGTHSSNYYYIKGSGTIYVTLLDFTMRAQSTCSAFSLICTGNHLTVYFIFSGNVTIQGDNFSAISIGTSNVTCYLTTDGSASVSLSSRQLNNALGYDRYGNFQSSTITNSYFYYDYCNEYSGKINHDATPQSMNLNMTHKHNINKTEYQEKSGSTQDDKRYEYVSYCGLCGEISRTECDHTIVEDVDSTCTKEGYTLIKDGVKSGDTYLKDSNGVGPIVTKKAKPVSHDLQTEYKWVNGKYTAYVSCTKCNFSVTKECNLTLNRVIQNNNGLFAYCTSKFSYELRNDYLDMDGFSQLIIENKTVEQEEIFNLNDNTYCLVGLEKVDNDHYLKFKIYEQEIKIVANVEWGENNSFVKITALPVNSTFDIIINSTDVDVLVTEATCSEYQHTNYVANFVNVYGATFSIEKEVVGTEYDPNNHSNYGTYVVDRLNPTTSSQGYSGDIFCSSCHELIELGHVLDIIVINEENKEEVKEIVKDNIIINIVPDVSEEKKEQIEEAIAKTDVETLTKISDVLTSGLSELDDVFDSVPQGQKVEVQPGVSLTKEEAKEVVQAVVESTIAIASGEEEANNKVQAILENIPNSEDINLGDEVSNFYERVLNEILGISTKEEEIKLVADEGNSNKGSIDYSISPETYKQAIEFVDNQVNSMANAAKRVKACSNESLKANINLYIQRTATSSFRNYNKEEADEKFFQVAYEAILINLQSQTLTQLEEVYNKNKSLVSGDKLQELENTYNDEVARVNVLRDIDDETNVDTFECMIVEVMRQKYISLLNSKFDSKEISQADYALEMDNTLDTLTFKPKYIGIFKCWALQLIDTSVVKITLEELSNAAITDTTSRLSVEPDSVDYSIKLSKIEKIVVFSSAVVLAILALISLGISIYNRREVIR